MKKKLLSLTMAFCLLVGSAMSVSAAQLQTDGETADVQVTYDQPSSFCVNIPESIDLNSTDGYRFTADSMNITDGQKVCIYAPMDDITLTNEYGLTGTARLYTDIDNRGKCVAQFERGVTTSDCVMYGQFDGFSAGHYEGTATFTIRLETKNQ